MNEQEPHPTRETLVDFAQGKLQAESLDEVAQHIQNCPTCVEFLEQSEDDTLVDQIRQAAKDDTSSSEVSVSFDVNSTQHFSTTEQTAFSIEEIFANHPKYDLIRQIGSGGMGAVYEAHHRIMDRTVAIKIIRPELVSNTEAVARFHNEVRAAAKLSHRNIVAAYDAEQVGSSHLLVMEFVVGESLAQTLTRKGPLPVTHACNYVLQIAQGLKHAHEQGMIHRDIKPQNLMKTPKGVIKILDFGLARIGEINDDDSKLTSTGVMMGTADYIAPEQARNARDADIRSDLYSLGCTFYFLLAGEAPFKKSGSRVDKILAHCSKPFPSILANRKDVPEQVAEIVGRLVAKAPAERFQNPQELIEILLPFSKPKSRTTESATSATELADKTQETNHSATVQSDRQIAGLDVLAPDAQTELAPQVFSVGQTPLANPIQAEPDLPTQPKSPAFATSNSVRNHSSRSLPAWKIATGTFGVTLLFLVLYLSGVFSGGGSGNQNEFNSGGGSQAGISGNQKSVAAIFVYDQFCYGDFGPLRDRLESNGIQLITVSTSKRTARFIDFPEDTTPNKQNVEIEYDLSELDVLVSTDKVDSIVFIGGFQLINGIGNSDSDRGKALLKIANDLKSKGGWLSAIGKGVNVPYSLGLLDQTTIVEVGHWLEATPRSEVQTIGERVFADTGNRVITAAEWKDSAALADEIISQLGK